MYDASEKRSEFLPLKCAMDANMRSLLGENFDLSDDLVEAVLSESAKFSRDVLAPLNKTGDVQGSTWHSDNTVTTPDGF